MLSKERRIFLYANLLALVISAALFAVIFSPQPLALSLIDPEKPVVTRGGQALTVGDLQAMFGIVAGTFGPAYVFALWKIRK